MALKRDKYDKVVSDLVRARTGVNYTCEHCGYQAPNDERIRMHCSHTVKARKHQSLRYSMLNCLCLCASCHAVFTDGPVEHGDWARSYLGDETVDDLIIQGNKVKKWIGGKDGEEKQAMYKHYKKELAHVEKERARGVEGRITVLDWETNARQNWLDNLEEV